MKMNAFAAALPIVMNPVKSSQIHSIGYDAATSTLAVRFTNMGTPDAQYQYSNVPEAIYTALGAAPSIGLYFRTHIKAFPLKYPHTQVELPQLG